MNNNQVAVIPATMNQVARNTVALMAVPIRVALGYEIEPDLLASYEEQMTDRDNLAVERAMDLYLKIKRAMP